MKTQQQYADLIQEVEDGYGDPLALYAELKYLATFFADAAKQIEPLAIDAASRYNEKTFQYQGFQFTRKEGSTIYSFANVPQWVGLKKQLEHIEKLAKQAARASVLTGGGHVVDENGEVIEPAESKTGKSSLSIKPI